MDETIKQLNSDILQLEHNLRLSLTKNNEMMILLIGFGDLPHDIARVKVLKSLNPPPIVYTISKTVCDGSDFPITADFASDFTDILKPLKYDIIFVDHSTLKFFPSLEGFFNMFTELLKVGGILYVDYFGPAQLQKMVSKFRQQPTDEELDPFKDVIYSPQAAQPRLAQQLGPYKLLTLKVSELQEYHPNLEFTRNPPIPYNLQNPEDEDGSYIAIKKVKDWI